MSPSLLLSEKTFPSGVKGYTVRVVRRVAISYQFESESGVNGSPLVGVCLVLHERRAAGSC
jgi:hypothetical protein